jgi:hypothetical protein
MVVGRSGNQRAALGDELAPVVGAVETSRTLGHACSADSSAGNCVARRLAERLTIVTYRPVCAGRPTLITVATARERGIKSEWRPAMTELPHDIADLYLAPVALEVDARIAEMGVLTDEKLRVQVAIESDEPDWSADLRTDALLRTLGRLVNLHGWLLSLDERGIRLSHGKHSLVLGAPANFGRYLEGAAHE